MALLTAPLRRWRVVLATTAIGLAAAAVVLLAWTPSYRAQATIFVTMGDSTTASAEVGSGSGTGPLSPLDRIQSYAALAQSPSVLDPVIAQLGLETDAAQLADHVSAALEPGTVLIDVAVDDPSAEQAAAIANSVAQHLAVIAPAVDKVGADDAPLTRLAVVQEAQVPASATSPDAAAVLGIGAGAGLVAGILAAVLRQLLDTRIRTERDVRAVTDRPVLTAVPPRRDIDRSPVPDPAAPETSATPWSEAYRRIRTAIDFGDLGDVPEHDDPPRTLLVASARPGEGRTLTAANLAASLAQGGRRTVLVEADLRDPGLAALLGLDGEDGLTTVIAGRATVEDAVQPVAGFDVLTTGPIPPNPSELLGSQVFRTLLDRLLETYDDVVVDSPPLLAVTDAAVVAASVDAVVVVCRAHRTRRAELRTALEQLATAQAGVVGVVLNGARSGAEPA